MILKDHSKDKIIQAIEASMTYYTTLVPLNNPKYIREEFNDLVRLITELNHPVANWIVRVRFNEQNAERRIAENIGFFREKKIPMMWIITPNSTPSNILNLLENYGVQIPKGGSPAMVYDLRNLTEDHWNDALSRSKIQVIKVDSDSSLKLWRKVFQEGYSLSESLTEIFLNLFLISKSSIFANYLVTINEKPVSISSILYSSGIAGIFNVATIPDYRGKGIGTAVTLAPLMDAKKKGYEIAWLESSEMGENCYKRIGFQEYCKFSRCIYSPKDERKSSE